MRSILNKKFGDVSDVLLVTMDIFFEIHFGFSDVDEGKMMKILKKLDPCKWRRNVVIPNYLFKDPSKMGMVRHQYS